MRDVIVLITISAFFALCVAYVALCDRIIGPDPEPAADAAAKGPVEIEVVPS